VKILVMTAVLLISVVVCHLSDGAY
jgi:hypothetical protein